MDDRRTGYPGRRPRRGVMPTMSASAITVFGCRRRARNLIHFRSLALIESPARTRRTKTGTSTVLKIRPRIRNCRASGESAGAEMMALKRRLRGSKSISSTSTRASESPGTCSFIRRFENSISASGSIPLSARASRTASLISSRPMT